MTTSKTQTQWAEVNNAATQVLDIAPLARFDEQPEKPAAPGKPYWVPYFVEQIYTDPAQPGDDGLVIDASGTTIAADEVVHSTTFRVPTSGEDDAAKQADADHLFEQPDTRALFDWLNSTLVPADQKTEQEFKDEMKALM